MRRTSIGHIRALLVLASILASLAMIPRVEASGMVVGQIVAIDYYDRPIALSRANITVYTNSSLVQSLSPSFDGSYSLILPSGNYFVIVEHPGFNSQSRFFQVSDGRRTRVDFRMDQISTLSTNAFDFGISGIDPILVSAGRTAGATIQVSLRSGSPQIVRLYLLGLPSGVSVSFSSSSGTPSFSTICTFMTYPSTIVGSYTVALIGIGGGITHRASLALMVSPRAYAFDMP